MVGCIMNMHKDAHRILREAFEKAGIADGFYGGVFYDGKSFSAFTVGIENRECHENVERTQRLIGIVNGVLFDLLNAININTEHEI